MGLFGGGKKVIDVLGYQINQRRQLCSGNNGLPCINIGWCGTNSDKCAVHQRNAPAQLAPADRRVEKVRVGAFPPGYTILCRIGGSALPRNGCPQSSLSGGCSR